MATLTGTLEPGKTIGPNATLPLMFRGHQFYRNISWHATRTSGLVVLPQVNGNWVENQGNNVWNFTLYNLSDTSISLGDDNSGSVVTMVAAGT